MRKIYQNNSLNENDFPILRDRLRHSGSNDERNFKFYTSVQYNFEKKNLKSWNFNIQSSQWYDTNITEYLFPLLGIGSFPYYWFIKYRDLKQCANQVKMTICYFTKILFHQRKWNLIFRPTIMTKDSELHIFHQITRNILKTKVDIIFVKEKALLCWFHQDTLMANWIWSETVQYWWNIKNDSQSELRKFV